ncbi:MAG: hypothetical protein ACR2MP_08095 [Streptosporangiaceae bacterium]
MHLTVLALADCPNGALLSVRLAEVVAGRRDVTVTRRVIADLGAAVRHGMVGSPTLLADGADLFAGAGGQPSMSCRLYDNGGGVLEGAPSVERLRALLAAAAARRPGAPRAIRLGDPDSAAACPGRRRRNAACPRYRVHDSIVPHGYRPDSRRAEENAGVVYPPSRLERRWT